MKEFVYDDPIYEIMIVFDADAKLKINLLMLIPIQKLASTLA